MALVPHITYAIVSPVSPPGKRTVAIKMQLFQAMKAAPCLSHPFPPMGAECGSCVVLRRGLALQGPLSCSACLFADLQGKHCHLIDVPVGAPSADCAVHLEGSSLSALPVFLCSRKCLHSLGVAFDAELWLSFSVTISAHRLHENDGMLNLEQMVHRDGFVK